MCHPIITAYVKGKALSRRDLFRGASFAGATIVVGAPKHQGGTGGPCRLIALI